MPVFSGIFWSHTISATGSVRRASDDRSSSACAAEVADSTRYSEPYCRFRSRVSAADTCGSSSTVRIVGRLMCCFPLDPLRRAATGTSSRQPQHRSALSRRPANLRRRRPPA